MDEKLLASLKAGWKENQKVGTASTTFGGLIQFSGTPGEKKKHLEKIKFAAAPDDELEGDATALEGDFVDVTYRALSAAMMGDRALDFSNEAVLRRSAPLLERQTVYKDHDTRTDNWVGLVTQTFWDNKTKGLPPGINAVLRLDTVKDPMTVRGVLQGALHSASVTVSFEWQPSHPKLMEEHNFWNNLGVEVDGEIVRIVVTKILKYWEISLVWQGADEYAKQIGEDGKPLNRYSFAADEPTEGLILAGHDGTEILNHEEDLIQEDNMSTKLKAELEKVLGSFNEETARETLEAHVTRKVEEGKADLSRALELANASTQELQKRNAELEGEKAKLTKQAELGEKYLNDTREEVVTLYRKAKGDKEIKEVFLNTFKNVSDLELLQAWKEDYQKEVELKFPLKCDSCKTAQKGASRQSSTLEAAEDGKIVSFNSPSAETARKLHA